MTTKLPVTLKSKSVSDNYNYKRLVESWRKGVDYATLFLDNGAFAPPKKEA
jgi:hypothetical protein